MQIEERILDYTIAKECSNPDAMIICHKCGRCGRVFEDGVMIHNGGTTSEDPEEE